MVPHAFGTSTSMIAFLVIFLSEDLEPRVATSLKMGQLCARNRASFASYQIVATPCLRSVKTNGFKSA